MKPLRYQKKVVREMEEFGGRVLCACDMGLGKTPMSLWFIGRNRPRSVPAVIVCPASVKYQWQSEIQKITGRHSFVCEGMTPMPLDGEELIVINYDVLSGWLQSLSDMRPGSVVLDECHYCQNPKAKRTKAVRRLCRGVQHVLALSGTPMLNRPIEMFPVLNILRPVIFRSRFKYALRYCDGKRNRWGWDFAGVSHSDELHELLKTTCMVRRRKADVLKDLPSKIRQVVPIPLKDPSEYMQAEENYLKWLGKRDPEASERARRAEALTKTGGLLKLAARLKMKAALDWLNEWLHDTDEQLVVFGIHRGAIRMLAKRLDAKTVVIDGSVTGRDREESRLRFQSGKARVLVGNVNAAGVGLNLTSASTVGFVEMPWQPGAVIQAEDRCHRIGQESTVWVHYLIAAGTVEEKMARIIQKKQETLSAVLDGQSNDEDIDILDLLMKEMS